MDKNYLGNIINLFISQKGVDKIISKNTLQLDQNGIIEDKFYNKDPKRSVLITSNLAYEKLEKHNIKANFGSLGENLLVPFNPYDLKQGTKLKVGDTILEIANECTICNHLNKIDDKVPALLQKDRGVFAVVLQGGTININDSIEIIN